MSDRAIRNNPTVAETINSEKNLTDNFITLVYERVYKKIEEKDEKRASNIKYIISLALAFLAVFAGGIYFSITNYIDNSICKRVDTEAQRIRSSFKEEISATLAPFRVDGLLVRLRDVSKAIDDDVKIDVAQRAQAMDLLKTYKNTGGSISDEFLIYVHKLLRSFQSANDNYYIDNIWTLYGDDLLSSKQVALLLLDVIGERCLIEMYSGRTKISPAGGGSNDGIANNGGEMKANFDKIKKIVAEKYRYPEITLLYDIGIAFCNGDSNIKKNYIGTELKYLSPEDRMNFLYRIFRYTKWEYWLKKEEKRGYVLQDIYGKLFDKYGKDIKQSVGEDAFSKIVALHKNPEKNNKIIDGIVAWWQATPLPN